MAWQPAAEPLRQLSGYLKDSLGGHNPTVQKQAELMLAQAKSSPDINHYLTYLFSSPQTPPGLAYNQNEYFLVRAAAAVMLKNNIKSGYATIPPESLAFIRSSVPVALQDPISTIRNYAGNVITEVVTRGGIMGWPELLPELLDLVGNSSGTVTPEGQEGAMAALAKICEDNRRALDKDYQGQRPLTFIIPKLIEFTANEKATIRSLALGTLNVFLPFKPQAMIVSFDAYLNRLIQLANDPSTDVRRQICRALVQMVELRPEKILPHMAGLVDYMVEQQRKIDHEELACDAAEFWLAVTDHDELWKSLEPFIDQIVPVLLESMVYSEDDMRLLGGGSNDAEQEDRQEDIKPQFAKSKTNKTTNGTDDDSLPAADYTKLTGEDLDDGEIDEDDEDDEDDESGENPEDRWNLRKCSAAALDNFATKFRGTVFTTILPYLMKNLRHEEWQYREAAVLALGAVADGCMDDVTPHLPDLVPYLISLLNDPEPLVRQITCWTLGRYSSWGANLPDPALRAKFFEPMMEGILVRMLDGNKRVQEAGVSAFAHLEEKAGAKLTPYLKPIIEQFVRCFEKYKPRNMLVLYDCVQTLAEHVGQGIARAELIDVLMPALIHRWNVVSDQSRELFPLLECLSYVAAALGPLFAPFAAPIYVRCIQIIHQNLEQIMAARENPILDTPDKDFLVTSLDLLSAIIQALKPEHSAALVSSSQPQLFELLKFCMEDPENEVRQSAYAILGDCAKHVYPQLRTFLPALLPVLIRQLDLNTIIDEHMETGFSVLNNACWSAGEIALADSQDLSPYALKIVGRFLEILGNVEVPKSVIENAAIALGRMGLYNPDVLAPNLALFAEPYLRSIVPIDPLVEKSTSFMGFLNIVKTNPQAMEKDLGRLITMMAKYLEADREPPTPMSTNVRQACQQILDLYKALIPDFNAFIGRSIPPAAVAALRRDMIL